MRRRVATLSLLALAALAACEYSAGLAPAARSRLAVHSVLNAGAGAQVVLVERTLVDGRHCSVFGEPSAGGEVTACQSDPEDPIVAAGGEPISGAEVVVYGADGDSAVAVEDLARRGDGKGAGVYRFANAAIDASRPFGERASLAIVPGGIYRLRVTTPLGTATARTTVPDAPLVTTAATLTFNVERGDVQQRAAVAAKGAAAYLVSLDEPLGRNLALFDTPVALVAFSDVLTVGEPKNTRPQTSFQATLVPGLVSEARVSALDSNYSRMLRAGTDEDPFSSENPGNSIENGVGVFGSIAPVTLLRLDVTSFLDDPIEGRYTIVEGPATAPSEIRLFSYRGALSGSYAPSDRARSAVLGGRGVDPPVRLTFYGDRFPSRPEGIFEGRYSAGQLLGSFKVYTTEEDTAGIAVVYRRTP